MLTARRVRAARERGGWRNLGVFVSRTAAQNRDTAQYSPDGAVQLAPVTAVVTYIARAAASSDLKLEKRMDDGSSEIVDEGLPGWLDPDLRPNHIQNRYEFIYSLATNLLISGNAGIRIMSRRADGVPDMVTTIPGNLLSVVVGGERLGLDEYIPGYGSLTGLRYVIDDGTDLMPYNSLMRDGEVMHLRLMTKDDLVYGRSPLMWATPPLRTALAADAYMEYSLTVPWPHGILANKGRLTAENAMSVAGELEKVRRDPDRVHLPPIVSGDWEFISTYIPPEQLQLLDTRRFNFSMVCSLYGVPEALISGPSGMVSGTAFRAMLTGYARGTQVPFNNMVAAYLSELTPPGYEVRLVPRHLTELDKLEESRVLERYVKMGAVLRSEVRQQIGLPPIVGIDDMPMPGAGPGDRGGDSDSGRDFESDERFTNEE